MKTLRYLLMMVAVMGVLSVSAQTPKYGKTYNPKNERALYSSVQVNAQMPEATIGSTSSEYMSTGSTLPQAAVTGTSTTYDNGSIGRLGHIRRTGEDEGFDDDDDPDKPGEPFPLGDVMWPFALCACAYVLARAFRKRRVRA